MPSQLMDAISNVIALLSSYVPDQALQTAMDAVSRVLGV